MTTRKHTRGRPTVGRIGTGKSHTFEVGALRRPDQSAANAHRFFVLVEGEEVDGRVRGANGIRWKVA